MATLTGIAYDVRSNNRQEDTLRVFQMLGAEGVVEVARLVRGFATYWCAYCRYLGVGLMW